MGDIKSLEQLSLVAAFVVPGIVALFVRAQFLTGRAEVTKEAVLTFFTIATLYYGLLAPFLPWLTAHGLAPTQGPVALFGWTVIGPALLGLALGVNASRGWTWRVFGRLGLKTVHVMPTAWDWKFGGMIGSWVVVTLKDGSQVAGWFGQRSFASSDPKERDLYVERVYRVDDDKQWHATESGLLVPQGELRCIEFWSDKES